MSQMSTSETDATSREYSENRRLPSSANSPKRGASAKRGNPELTRRDSRTYNHEIPSRDCRPVGPEAWLGKCWSAEVRFDMVLEDAIQKAAVLIEAMPYIRIFRDRAVVVKFGGAAMESPDILDQVLLDVVFLETVGMRPVLVHGGGPAISAAMKARGKEPRFVHGHRVTDAETLEIARDVLANRINADICERLECLGGRAEAIASGTDGALQARRKLAEHRGGDGAVERIDLGFVGDMTGVDSKRFHELCGQGVVPVVAPLATGPDGEVLNVNADVVAGFLAGALGAEKAVFLSDTHGILQDPDDDKSFANSLSEAQVEELVSKGVIDGGMLPKVAACIAALDGGVRKAHIVDGRIKHSLLLEIFTDQGVGTQIVK